MEGNGRQDRVPGPVEGRVVERLNQVPVPDIPETGFDPEAWMKVLTYFNLQLTAMREIAQFLAAEIDQLHRSAPPDQ